MKLISTFNSYYKNLAMPARTSIIIFICSILRKAIGFFAVPVYTRIVDSEQYGIYSLYQSWESLVLIIATLNMWNYLVNNGMIKYPLKKDLFLSSLTGLNLAITFFWSIIYFCFHITINDFTGLSTMLMIVMLLNIAIYPSFEYWSSRKRYEYDVKYYAIFSIIITILTPIISVILVKVFDLYKPDLSAYGLIIGRFLGSTFIYGFVFIFIIFKGRKLFNYEIWKYALSFSLPLIPHFFASVILQQSDRIMIDKICGASFAGIYSVAYSLGVVMIFVNDALNSSVIPWTYQSMEKKDYSHISKVSEICLLIVASINVLLSLFAPELIAIMAPTEYAKAVYVIPPVAMSNILILLFNFYANIEYYYEKTKLVAIASCLSAVLNIVLNYLFIPMFGFVAAGYTTVICYVIYALCHLVLMRHVLKDKNITDSIYNNAKLWLIFVVASAIALSSMLLYEYLMLRLLLVAVAIGVCVVFRHRLLMCVHELMVNKK